MLNRHQSDHAAAAQFYARLGGNYEPQSRDAALRYELFQILGPRIDRLERLAEQDAVTLCNLGENGLLPKSLANKIFSYSTTGRVEDQVTASRFRCNVGALTDLECEEFSRFYGIGTKAIEMMKLLARLHRETSGFKILSIKDLLTTAERSALVERIEEGIRRDPNLGKRLLLQFPPSTP